VTGYKPWYQTVNSQLFKKYYQLSPWKNLERPLALKNLGYVIMQSIVLKKNIICQL